MVICAWSLLLWEKVTSVAGEAGRDIEERALHVLFYAWPERKLWSTSRKTIVASLFGVQPPFGTIFER